MDEDLLGGELGCCLETYYFFRIHPSAISLIFIVHLVKDHPLLLSVPLWMSSKIFDLTQPGITMSNLSWKTIIFKTIFHVLN